MENKITENDGFFETKYSDAEMAEKYQELLSYTLEDKNGINFNLDNLKKDYPADNGLLVCSIFAVNFWRKEKNEIIDINKIDNNDEIDQKTNEIKHMMDTLNKNTELVRYRNDRDVNLSVDIQSQINMVNSIEKIFGAFMSIDPQLFDIEKFDGFMNMSNENFAKFYNAIWAAYNLSSPQGKSIMEVLMDKYRTFLNNNKVMNQGKNLIHRCLFKMNLALNENDLTEIETRIKKISEWVIYANSLYSAFSCDSFSSIKIDLPKDNDIVGLLKLQQAELSNKYSELNNLSTTENSSTKSNQKLKNLYFKFSKLKSNLELNKRKENISDLKNNQLQEIKNNLEEKILWNNECTIEKREDFFETTNSFNNMQKRYKEHKDFVKKNSIFADLSKPIDDVVKRFSEVNPDLQLKDENDKKNKQDKSEITIENELRNKYKDVHAATFTVNHFHKNNKKISDDQQIKIDESIAIMHALETDKDAPVVDLNKAACIIEKFFLAFVDFDITAFDIKKFDSFVNIDSKTYMEFMEVATAASHAYKFIEKYQEFIDVNENLDKEIKKITNESEKKGYENSKINLALSKSDFEKVKKKIDKMYGFVAYSTVLLAIFKHNSHKDIYDWCKTNASKCPADLNSVLANDANLGSFLKSLLAMDFEKIRSLALELPKGTNKLLIWLATLKKNMLSILIDPKKLQIEKKTLENLRKKIHEQEKTNAEESDKKNVKMIQDSYKKIKEDVFNKKYGTYGYNYIDCSFVEKGKIMAQNAIDKEKGTIAREFFEFEKERVEQRVREETTNLKNKSGNKDIADILENLKKKEERMKKNTGGNVPRIVVEDKYFDAEFEEAEEEAEENEELYPDGKISIFDECNNLLIKQKQNTCYLMAILIGLVDNRMEEYIRKNIIKQDTNDKTKAVVRLFNADGQPVDIVVSKTKFKNDKRLLWIQLFEKAFSVVTNNTDFKSKNIEKNKNRNKHGAQIKGDVDWIELEKKQKNKEEIFEEKAFSRSCISDGRESLGCQVIFGTTCVSQTTGKAGRKIKYAEEGDKALGFLSEVLSAGKLVIGSTYYDSFDPKDEIPYNRNGIDYVGFNKFNKFNIPQMHVVFFKSIDWDKKKITTIDSNSGKHSISFADFKKYFSDIYATDFPKEAEKMREHEFKKELDQIANKSQECKKNIIEENLSKLDGPLENIKTKLETLQKNIKYCDTLNKNTSDLLGRIESEIENLNGEMSSFQREIEDSDQNLNNNIEVMKEKLCTDTKVSTENIDKLVVSIEEELRIGNIESFNLNQLKSKQKLIEELVKVNISELSSQIKSMKNQILDALYEMETIGTNLKKPIIDNDTINTATTQQKSDNQILPEINLDLTEITKSNNLGDYSQKYNELESSITNLETQISQCATVNQEYNTKDIDSSIKSSKLAVIKVVSSLQALENNEKIFKELKNDPNAKMNSENIKQIEETFNELSKKSSEKKIREKTSKLSELIKKLQGDFNNSLEKIKEIDTAKATIENQKSVDSNKIKIVKDGSSELEKKIKMFNGNKKAFETKINTILKRLNGLEANLNNSNEKIVESAYKKLDEVELLCEYVEQQMKKLEELNKKSNDISYQLSKEIYRKYNIVSNKIKKGGLVATVFGVLSSVCVLIIPGVAIGFILITLSITLIGFILLGICLYREKKRPSPEMITTANYTDKNGIDFGQIHDVVLQQAKVNTKEGKNSDTKHIDSNMKYTGNRME